LGDAEKGWIVSGPKGYEAEKNKQGHHQEKNGPDFMLSSSHKNLFVPGPQYTSAKVSYQFGHHLSKGDRPVAPTA